MPAAEQVVGRRDEPVAHVKAEDACRRPARSPRYTAGSHHTWYTSTATPTYGDAIRSARRIRLRQRHDHRAIAGDTSGAAARWPAARRAPRLAAARRGCRPRPSARAASRSRSGAGPHTSTSTLAPNCAASSSARAVVVDPRLAFARRGRGKEAAAAQARDPAGRPRVSVARVSAANRSPRLCGATARSTPTPARAQPVDRLGHAPVLGRGLVQAEATQIERSQPASASTSFMRAVASSGSRSSPA